MLLSLQIIAAAKYQQLTGNDEDEMPVAQTIETQWYSLAELRWHLSRVRGRRVPERTLRWWLQELCIESNEFGLYSIQDLHVLTRLVLFLKRCRSIAKFKTLLIQEIATHAD